MILNWESQKISDTTLSQHDMTGPGAQTRVAICCCGTVKLASRVPKAPIPKIRGNGWKILHMLF